MKHILIAIIAFGLVVAQSFCPAFAAPRSGASGSGDVFSSNGQGNDWWLRQAQRYPRCADPANQGHTLTQQIWAAAYEHPEDVRKVNVLSAKREKVKKQLFACIRDQYASNGNANDCKPGAKGLSYEAPSSSCRTSPKVPPNNSTSILVAFDHCMQAPETALGVPYYRSPTLHRYSGPLKNAGNVISYNPSGLDGFPLPDRAYLLATSFAHYTLGLRSAHDLGAPPPGAVDEIVGFLARCLADDKILPTGGNNSPNDPRLTFGDYLDTYQGVHGAAARQARVDNFSHGYWAWPLAPVPLLP